VSAQRAGGLDPSPDCSDPCSAAGASCSRELGRAAAEATSELVRRGVGADARPGIVVSIATAGDLVQWHPHLHLLTTDGARTADGSWTPLPERDALLLMRLFRERLLARLLESHAISQELVCRLVAWRHSGFSAHVGERIEPENKQHLEDTAAYLVRNPLSLKKLVYLDGERAVIYRSRMNPSLGRNFEAMDPLEWLARLSDHIPDPGQHRTLFYGEYSSRVSGRGEPTEPAAEDGHEIARWSSANQIDYMDRVEALFAPCLGGRAAPVPTSPLPGSTAVVRNVRFPEFPVA